MFDQKKHITEENKIRAKELAEWLIYPLATDEDILDIVHDKENYHHKVRLALWQLSLREWWVYTEALAKIKEVMRVVKLKTDEEEKNMEMSWKKKELLKKKIIDQFDKFQIVNDYWDQILVIWFPYVNKKERVEKFAWTTLVHQSETPELFKRLKKALHRHEG